MLLPVLLPVLLEVELVEPPKDDDELLLPELACHPLSLSSGLSG